MRLWMHTYAQTTAVTPSAMLSVAAHAVFVGAAVYGTGERSRELSEQVAQRVYYLPPPDRSPTNDALVERISYVEVGNGARLVGREDPAGAPAARPSDADDGGGRDTPGVDELDQAAQAPFESPDSVYSVLNVEETAVRVEGSAAPVYPPELIEQRVEGAVLTSFVIDTTGLADPGSIEVVQSTHALFTQSVRSAIPGMRFSPATVQGRKVRQIVEQRFQFRITPPPVSAPAEHTRTTPVP
jgi:TonB family protein